MTRMYADTFNRQEREKAVKMHYPEFPFLCILLFVQFSVCAVPLWHIIPTISLR